MGILSTLSCYGCWFFSHKEKQTNTHFKAVKSLGKILLGPYACLCSRFTLQTQTCPTSPADLHLVAALQSPIKEISLSKHKVGILNVSEVFQYTEKTWFLPSEAPYCVRTVFLMLQNVKESRMMHPLFVYWYKEMSEVKCSECLLKLVFFKRLVSIIPAVRTRYSQTGLYELFLRTSGNFCLFKPMLHIMTLNSRIL